MAKSGSILGNPVVRRGGSGDPARRDGVLRRSRDRRVAARRVRAVDDRARAHRVARQSTRRGRCRASSPCTSSGDLDLPDHHGFVMLPPTMNRPPLARGKVRFVGDIVAMVIAETKAQARRRRGSGDRRLRPAARGGRHRSRARAGRADRARGPRLERRQRNGHRPGRGHPRRRRRRRVAARREPAPRRGADGAERHHRGAG